MKDSEDDPQGLELDAVRKKYLRERDKRLVEGRAAIRDLRADRHFADYRRDPFTEYEERDAVSDDVDVAIIGGGMAGVVAGAQLRKAGVRRIRIIDEAGGIGGTWYWNRYPGVMCDVESYTYLPMLEDRDYIPRNRYAFGDE
ncbi:MAG: NAD(P)-binding protein, partial [Myxococcota bacterium]|nr:NAD(P)-binding protein [Myxococcota bacterium]